MQNVMLESKDSQIANALEQKGWCVIEEYFDISFSEQLALEAQQLFQNQQMQVAGVGRGKLFQRAPEVRQDVIYWLSPRSPLQDRYLQRMEALRQALNRELFLGLFDFEAHFAVYQPGTFYKKHQDSFKGAANRVVSVVTYLNINWPKNKGGELCIYASDNETAPIITIQPNAGKLIVFLSETIPHEVLPAQQQRLSIAGWFRVKV